MSPHQRDFLLAQICSGELALECNGKIYFYKQPNESIKYRASIKYHQSLESSFEILTKQDMLAYLESQGKWSPKMQEEVDVHIPKVLDELRVDIYLATINQIELIPSLKEKIRKVKEHLIGILSTKHQYDEYTIEGLAEQKKQIYLVKKCIKKLDIAPELLIPSLHLKIIPETDIRELARSSEWAIKWVAFKRGVSVFSGPLTEDQERLIRWTTLYENVLESQNPPSDAVLEDDDAFDGFLIFRRQENQRSADLDALEQKIGGRDKGGSCEVYLPAKNIEEAQRINLMNTPDARRTKENRFNQIEKMGVVKQAQLQDERIKIEMEVNRMSQ